MTLSNSIFAVSGAATFLDARKDMSNLFACDTSLEPHPGLLSVGGGSAANGNVVVGMSNRMAVTVRPFQAVLNRLGALLIMNDGDVVVSLQAAPSANSRIDVVYVKQREKRAPISDSEDGPIIGVVTGTANLTPVAPRVPDGAVALAQVKVPSGVTNTTASGVVITQVYPFAATRGEELRFRTKGDMDAFAALGGTKAVVLADNAHYVRNGGKWEAEPEDRWYRFDLKFQDTSSFVPILYGGASNIFWNPKLRLISVRLASFTSRVAVNTFQVYLPSKGTFNVSDNIGLGQAEFQNFTGRGAELTLNSNNGTISVGPQMSANDVFRPLGSFVVPIPSNVTVRAEGGIPL